MIKCFITKNKIRIKPNPTYLFFTIGKNIIDVNENIINTSTNQFTILYSNKNIEDKNV